MVKRLFLTPPSLPEETARRCLDIPDSKEWWGMLNAALLLLTQEWQYEQVNPTDLTPAAVAAQWFTIYQTYLLGECGVQDVRQSILDPCTLEKTFDGETWLSWANILACAATVGATAPITQGDIRIDPTDPDNAQWSPDGGTTWFDVPPGPTEPFVATPGPTPGATAADQRCLAARRAALTIGQLYAATFSAVAAGLANALGTFNQFLYEMNSALLGLVYGQQAQIINAAILGDQDFPTNWSASGLTGDQLDTLTCLLYDNASADADAIVSFNYAAVRDNAIAELGVNPGTAVTALLVYIQEGGLNAAGGVNVISSYDCIDCIETCIFQSFAGQAQGWTIGSSFGFPTATLTASGFASRDVFGDKMLAVHLNFTNTFINQVTLTFDRNPSGSGPVSGSFSWVDPDDVSHTETFSNTGNDIVRTFSINAVAKQVSFFNQLGTTGTALLENATIEYMGADPGFIGSPC